MVLSLTVMPVLASLLLPRRMEETDPWLVRLARWFYAPLLRLALRNGVVVLRLPRPALAARSLAARSDLGKEFMPDDSRKVPSWSTSSACPARTSTSRCATTR